MYIYIHTCIYIYIHIYVYVYPYTQRITAPSHKLIYTHSTLTPVVHTQHVTSSLTTHSTHTYILTHYSKHFKSKLHSLSYYHHPIPSTHSPPHPTIPFSHTHTHTPHSHSLTHSHNNHLHTHPTSHTNLFLHHHHTPLTFNTPLALSHSLGNLLKSLVPQVRKLTPQSIS